MSTFNTPDRPTVSSTSSTSDSAISSSRTGGTVYRGRDSVTPPKWGQPFSSPQNTSSPPLPKPPRQDRSNGGVPSRWKLLAVAMCLITIHTLSVNIIVPMFTSQMVGLDTRHGFSTSADTSFFGASHGMARLLSSESADTAKLDPTMGKYGKDGRGRPIYVQRDSLSNPFLTPPKSVTSAKNITNLQPYDPKKPKVVNYLYREKCHNDAIVPYETATGQEWSMSCKHYVTNYGDAVSKYRWCRGGTATEVPDLKQILQFKSNRTRDPRAVTIVTQLSVERLSMLEQQCNLWPHTISAVAYIPLVKGKIFSSEEEEWHNQPLEAGIEEMTKFYEKMKDLSCILDLEVVVEERCHRDLASMYPANAVRNRALMMAESEIVLLLDVDFVPSLNLAQITDTDENYEALLSQLLSHKALVLPAFEAWDQNDVGKRLALEAVRKGKGYISSKFMYNIVIGFHMSHYPQGHEKTNFWRWINTTEPYEVEYQTGFEPYILMPRRLVPYYDERFRGYYWNKVQHLMHISTQEAFTFVVHPEAFVVHVPHKKPAMKWKTRRSGQKERNHIMFLEALEEMKKNRFVPVTGFPHLCLPPNIATAAAELVTSPAQKKGLLSVAELVAKPPSETAFEMGQLTHLAALNKATTTSSTSGLDQGAAAQLIRERESRKTRIGSLQQQQLDSVALSERQAISLDLGLEQPRHSESNIGIDEEFDNDSIIDYDEPEDEDEARLDYEASVVADEFADKESLDDHLPNDPDGGGEDEDDLHDYGAEADLASGAVRDAALTRRG